MSKYLMLASILGCALFAPLSAPYAADEDKKTNKVIESHDAFAEKLDEQNKAHFEFIYSNYNIIQVVKTVHKSVSTAAEACSDKNPDMADEIEARYSAWDEEITTVLKEAEGHLNNMVIVQDYADKDDFEDLFEIIREVRASEKDVIKKVPVTTEEGCQHMLDNLSSTQENLTKLLRATLMSVPEAIQMQEDIKKRKSEEE